MTYHSAIATLCCRLFCFYTMHSVHFESFLKHSTLILFLFFFTTSMKAWTWCLTWDCEEYLYCVSHLRCHMQCVSFRGKLGRYPPWPGKVSKWCQCPSHWKLTVTIYIATLMLILGIFCVCFVPGSKSSQGPEKAQGQKMPFCEILWNWRPVSSK